MKRLSFLELAPTLVTLGVFTACEPTSSSSTHWLTCNTLADCTVERAASCDNGYCVDNAGDRIAAAGATFAKGGSAGQPNSVAGSSIGGSSSGSSGGASPSGTASGGGASGATGGTPTSGGTVSDGGAAGSPTISNAGAAGTCAGVAVPSDALKACSTDDECQFLSFQTDCCGTYLHAGIRKDQAVAHAACLAARAPYPACGCAGRGVVAEDGRQASFVGTEVGVSCVSGRCMTQVVARTCGTSSPTICGAGSICVGYQSVVGPTSTTDYACVANPCGNTFDCNCAQATCDLRTDTKRNCMLVGAGATSIDIECVDTRQ